MGIAAHPRPIRTEARRRSCGVGASLIVQNPRLVVVRVTLIRIDLDRAIKIACAASPRFVYSCARP